MIFCFIANLSVNKQHSVHPTALRNRFSFIFREKIKMVIFILCDNVFLQFIQVLAICCGLQLFVADVGMLLTDVG